MAAFFKSPVAHKKLVTAPFWTHTAELHAFKLLAVKRTILKDSFWPDSAIQLPQYLLIANGCFTGLDIFCRFQ